VGQGQEGQEQVLFVEIRAAAGGMGVEQDVAVTEHHALGLAGGARGIDDGGQLVGLQGMGLQLALEAEQPVGQGIQARVVGLVIRLDGVHGDDAPETFEAVAHLQDLLPLQAALHHHQLHIGLAHDVGDVLGAVVGVQGHGDQAQPQTGLVEHHPFPAVAQHDRHPVAGLEALLEHGLLPSAHLGGHLAPGALHPGVLADVKLAIGQRVGGTADPFNEKAGQ